MPKKKTLKHLGIILDGNRRFAKRLMIKPWKGHEWGAKKLERLFEWCKEFDIKELTLYCFSIQNFNRPKKEFDYLMNLFRAEFKKLKNDARIHKNKIRINVIGRTNLFPKDIQQSMKEVMERTKNHSRYVINFAMGYGGREEIVDAVRRIARDVKKGKIDADKIDEKAISKNLYLKSEPDLIIRTGGEHRTSNFLLWQSSYSELLFIEKMWPEFSKKDLALAISNYQQRERRFGR